MNAVPDQTGCRVSGRAVDLQHSGTSRHARRFHMIHERLRDGLSDRLVVEGDVVIGRLVGDRAVIGDDLHILRLGNLHQRGGGGAVHRVQHDDFRTLRDDRVELLLLQRRIPVGILIDHGAARTMFRHGRFEAGEVVLLIAGRCLIRH